MIDMLARPLFRVGDIVTIEPDIVDDNYYMLNGGGERYWFFVESMYRYCGHKMRLDMIDADCYRIDCTGMLGWVDGMFVESNRVTKFLEVREMGW